MAILNNFGIFRQFPHNLQINIKCFYASHERSYCTKFNDKHFAYCVTDNDLVYGLGESVKIEGYPQNIDKQYVCINELKEKNIQEFFHESNTMFALSNNGQVYYWSRNLFYKHGHSIKWKQTDCFSKPKRIKYFDDKNIVQISYSWSGFLALSVDGTIYVSNKKCRVTREHVLNVISSSLKFEPLIAISDSIRSSNNMIKFIHCCDTIMSGVTSIFITSSGDLYKYSATDDWKLSLNIIELMTNECQTIDNQEFDVYPNNMNEDLTFHFNNFVYTMSMYSEMEKTNYQDIFEYVLLNYHNTFRTIYLNSGVAHAHFLINDNENKKLTKKSIKIETDQGKLNEIQSGNILPQILDSDVKCYIQSKDENSENYSTFLVLKNENVYFRGQQFDHDDDYEIVPELCGMNIEEFYLGSHRSFARTHKNEIFEWGSDYHFGVNSSDNKRTRFISYSGSNKAQKINFFDNKNIVLISCGDGHYLALSFEGIAYGWGQNQKAQLTYDTGDKLIETPIILNDVYCIETKIKYIYCETNDSFFITTDDIIYGFGETFGKNSLIINISGVNKICLAVQQQTCFILDDQGQILELNVKNKSYELFHTEPNVLDIHIFGRDILFLCEECVYQLKYEDQKRSFSTIKTNFINSFDYLLSNYNCFNKTIHISVDGYLYTKTFKFNDEYNNNSEQNLLICENKNVFDRKYQITFEELDKIGTGSFGKVFRVRSWQSNEQFAVKCIEVKSEFDLNEIRVMFKIKNDSIVRCVESWIEGRVMFRKKIQKFLFIQMDLCSQNLRHFLEDSKKLIKNSFVKFNFFLSSKMFVQLTECVNYLHESNPPIIHRDLKPENILISDERNGRFFKLCDFGLAKVHQNSVHSKRVGTDAYMAPEVKTQNNYNFKSDVYSLALIGTEIFHFDDNIKNIRIKQNLNNYLINYNNHIPDEKINCLKELMNKCLFSEHYNERPSCKQILADVQEFNFDKTYLQTTEDYKHFINEMNELDNCLYKQFTKFNL